MTDIDAKLKRKQESLTLKSIWTFAKQETSFDDVFKAACIFASIAHPENESIEEYFVQHDFNGFKCNHRMLSSAQLFGLVTKTGSRYSQESVTPVFRELRKYPIGSDEYNTIKTEQLLKIKMSAIIDRNDNSNTHHILPVFYIFDVLYALHLRGIDSISTEQLFSYVMTCDSYDDLHDTVEILSTNPLPSEHVNYYMGNSRMWTLIDKNCKLFKIKNGRVSINPNYIEFFYSHFFMNTINVIESILNSIIDYPEAYSKALTTYQNLDIDLTQDTPKAFVRFKETNPSLENCQEIYYGAPGTGKSHKIDEIIKNGKYSAVRTTFHPDSDYSTFVGAYKPVMDETNVQIVPVVINNGISLNQNEGTYKEKRITYKFVMQAFTKAYLSAWKKMADNPDNPQPQFLVIEEINRGNCAQIFGDLFQLLDRGSNCFSSYPIEADTDLHQAINDAFENDKDYKLIHDINVEGVVKNYISNYGSTLSEDIQEGRILLLPPNLYIWATMNTSDQSLFPIDSAFKRRWEWKYMKIKDEGKKWKIDVKIKDANGEEKLVDWWDFIRKVNDIIASMTSSADKQLGYFFCKADKKTPEKASEPNSENDLISVDTFVSKVLFYLWNDVFKDYGFEDASLFQYTKTEDGKETKKDLTFPDFYEEDSNDVNPTMVTDFVQKVMNWKKKEEEKN